MSPNRKDVPWLNSIRIDAPAKINLALNIVGVLDNGYHQLQMVTQTVDLYDHITVSIHTGSSIQVFCNHPQVPTGKKNIAVACAKGFFAQTKIPQTGLDLHIHKHIPLQAGLAGGSADAAGVLMALNKLFDAGLSMDELAKIGMLFGADIPYCLMGGLAKVEGMGQLLTPLPSLKNLKQMAFVIAKPTVGIATQQAFDAYDRLVVKPYVDLNPLLQGIQSKKLQAIGSGMGNVLESVCPHPQVFALKQQMLQNGAFGAIMTGSGSAVVGLCSIERAEWIRKNLLAQNQSTEVFICHSTDHGAMPC